MLTMTCDKCGVGIQTSNGRKFNGRHRFKFGDGNELVVDLCEACSRDFQEQLALMFAGWRAETHERGAVTRV